MSVLSVSDFESFGSFQISHIQIRNHTNFCEGEVSKGFVQCEDSDIQETSKSIQDFRN